jgi:hypothetical protein
MWYVWLAALEFNAFAYELHHSLHDNSGASNLSYLNYSCRHTHGTNFHGVAATHLSIPVPNTVDALTNKSTTEILWNHISDLAQPHSRGGADC